MRNIAIATLCIASAAATAAQAAPKVRLPTIGKVTYTQASAGIYNVTISGRHFGAPPAGIPCTNCFPQQVQVAQYSEILVNPITVTSWSDNSIALANVALAANEPAWVSVWSAAANNAAARGAIVSPHGKRPHITSIAASGSGAALTLVINGSGFGPAPGQIGQTTNSPYFIFNDLNAAAFQSSGEAGGYPWNAGFCNALVCDGVTATYTSWSDSQITISGFGSAYGSNDWYSTPQDAYCVTVWPTTGDGTGTTGGAVACGRLP